MYKIAGKNVPGWALALIGIAVVIIAAYALWPSGNEAPKNTDDQGMSLFAAGETLNTNAKGELMNKTHTAKLIGSKYVLVQNAPSTPTAPVLPVTVSEASQSANQTADDGADELVPESKPKTKGKTIKMSVFKDWVSDELTIQDSDISEFIVFADKTAVEDFVKGYSWNDKFDFQWNCDVLGIDIANDYGEADPAPATFGTTGTSGNIYFVALSSDGITPDYFQLDSNKDSKPDVIEKKSGKKTVLALDDWSTDAL